MINSTNTLKKESAIVISTPNENISRTLPSEKAPQVFRERVKSGCGTCINSAIGCSTETQISKMRFENSSFVRYSVYFLSALDSGSDSDDEELIDPKNIKTKEEMEIAEQEIREKGEERKIGCKNVANTIIDFVADIFNATLARFK